MVTKRLPILDGGDRIPAVFLPAGTPAGTLATLYNVTAYGAIGDGTTDDTAAVGTANTAAAAAGGTLWFPAGTYLMTSMTLYSNVKYQGAGHYATVLLQKAATSGDFLISNGFSGQTLQGNGGGISGMSLRDITIDGNKGAQSAANRCVAIYGFDFDLRSLHIRNAKGDGLYTEWAGGIPPAAVLPDSSMEARYDGLKIHDNGGWGWRNRGPHDSTANSVIVHDNTSGGYLGQSSPTGCTIAAGSNGASLPQATINVNTTVGLPTAGTVVVVTGGGNQTVTYTGLTATTLTGCSGGTGSMATGGAVTMPNYGYSTGGMLFVNSHSWGTSQSVAWQVEVGAHRWVNCVAEGASGVQVWLRAPDCYFGGSVYYSLGSGPGAGVRLGDSHYSTVGTALDVELLGFTGSSSTTAAIDFAGDGGLGSVTAKVYQPTGTALWGSIAGSSRLLINTAGASGVTDAGNSRAQWNGATRISAGTAAGAFTVTNGSNDVLNVNTAGGTPVLELTHGADVHGFSDDYGTEKWRIYGASGDANLGKVTPRGGVVPVAAGFNCFYTGNAGNLINTSSGSDQVPVAGTIYYAALLVPMNVTLSGAAVTVGTVGGTDKWIISLHDNTGAKLANSALAGTTAGTAFTKQQIDFTAPIAATGPGVYFLALQSNGTTARFRGFNNNVECFVTGSAAGTFGTIPTLALSTSYNINVGPYACTY